MIACPIINLKGEFMTVQRRRRRVESTQQPAGSNTIQQPIQQSREITEKPGRDFEVREGDRLTVMYNGVKLSIAPYSTVELDGSIYSRTLKPGDDPDKEWDRIYSYLKENSLKEAREKLRVFSEELANSQQQTRRG